MEYQDPHSQERCPGKKRQTMWAQSLYILGNLLSDVGGAGRGVATLLPYVLTSHCAHSTAEFNSSRGD